MNNPVTIPASFTVPKRCRHRWIFVAGACRSEIKGVPGRAELVMEQFEIGVNPLTKDEMNVVMSRNMDWIAEAVEHLRFLCEK